MQYPSYTIFNRILYCGLFIGSAYAYKRLFDKEREILIKCEYQEACSLHPQQYKLLTYSSCLPFLVGMYGFKRGYHDLATMSIGGGITSVLYWYKPDYSWRRTLDIHYIRFALIYHVIRSYGAEYSKYLYFCYTMVGMIYPTEMHFYLKKRYWLYTFSHMIVHVFGNTGNYILYSGYIPQLKINF